MKAVLITTATGKDRADASNTIIVGIAIATAIGANATTETATNQVRQAIVVCGLSISKVRHAIVFCGLSISK
jgi:hypothetical protein